MVTAVTGTTARQQEYAARQPADRALVERVLAGDRDTFAILVDRHKCRVFGLAQRLLGNAADAEDAAQETFVRAYTRLGTYRPDTSFANWLGAICSHWCIDTLRTRGRRVQTVALGKVSESERFVSPWGQPEAEVLDAAARAEVRQRLQALPLKYGLILHLHYFQELSYAEIAATLGESTSAVRMRLFRARALLQRDLVREAPPPQPDAGASHRTSSSTSA